METGKCECCKKKFSLVELEKQGGWCHDCEYKAMEEGLDKDVETTEESICNNELPEE